jgi:hypothetical protein
LHCQYRYHKEGSVEEKKASTIELQQFLNVHVSRNMHTFRAKQSITTCEQLSRLTAGMLEGDCRIRELVKGLE